MKTESVYEEKYNGYLIEIFPDDCSYDDGPREWDNVGTIATWHRNYKLGDIQPKTDPTRYMLELLNEVLPTSFRIPAKYDGDLYEYLEEWSDEDLHVLFSKYFVSLPVYMYDHSGITINTTGFSCPWDSGQLGLIYVSKKKYLEEMQRKGWTKDLEQKAIRLLKAEIETYDDYITGNVYGYVVSSLDNDGETLETIDSVWGYYPSHENHRLDYQDALDDARSRVDSEVEDDKDEQAILDARMMNEKVGE